MEEKKRILEELETINSLGEIAQAYEEISVVRMQKIRDAVLKADVFFSRLDTVYNDLKRSYRNQILELAKKKGGSKDMATQKVQTLAKNGRKAIVFVSANAKLYGEIVGKIFSSFYEQSSKEDADIVIVGRVGKELFENKSGSKKYQYFELSDQNVTYEDLSEIANKLLSYDRVTVYYGRFINLANQTPVFLNLSGDWQQEQQSNLPTPSEETEKPSNTRPSQQESPKQQGKKFLFEPDLENILSFFESQIFTSLFQQTLQDSQLARHASRIVAMEKALENISQKQALLEMQGKRASNRLLNKKQLGTIAGISIWGDNS